jgi:phosphoribosylformylglycinamidine (FGAM) synthase-like amidotransferase family enzyme
MTKTLILSGFGTNCERETEYACRKAGAEAVEVRHITEIYTTGIALQDYGFLVLIGGFMDGDDLGSGRACANRFRYRPIPAPLGGGTFLERLHRFIGDGRPVLGICNGFQVLAKCGLLPGALEEPAAAASGRNGGAARGEGAQRVTVTNNASGRFEDRWVHLRIDPASPCVFTQGMDGIELPVRHGEGRILAESEALAYTLVERHLAPLRYSLPDGTPTEAYPANPNGSALGLASLCSVSGTVLGMMPHPEAFNHFTNHPQWTRRPHDGEEGAGLQLFRNAYRYLGG